MSLDTIRELLKPDARYVERIEGVKHEWDGRIFTVETLSVRLSDDSTSWREIVRHNGGAGVCAVRDGKICLVRQYRVALERMSLEIPAGKLDPGEDPAVCAARELEEETGLVATEIVPLAVTAGAPGFNNEKTRIFAALGFEEGDAQPDDGEFVDVVWVPIGDMVEAIRAGLIEDAKTVVSVLAAAAGLV
ncbi:MAG: NUDIX hydrolase [Atopobiaceae bacterium]|nr:NUDIX hydrolase [Atopobiaceae bacterium]